MDGPTWANVLHFLRHVLETVGEIITRTNCFRRCPSISEEENSSKKEKE